MNYNLCTEYSGCIYSAEFVCDADTELKVGSHHSRRLGVYALPDYFYAGQWTMESLLIQITTFSSETGMKLRVSFEIPSAILPHGQHGVRDGRLYPLLENKTVIPRAERWYPSNIPNTPSHVFRQHTDTATRQNFLFQNSNYAFRHCKEQQATH